MNLKEVLTVAKQMTAERLAESPDYELYIEVDRQLKLIKSNVESGNRPTDEQKEEISIGLIAVREFEQTDEEFADILGKVSYLYKHPEVDSVDA